MTSKVLYVEQLPSHWTEDHLRQELEPFGDVRKIVLLRKRNAIYAGYNPSTLEPIRATTIQALIEAVDVDAAALMLQRLEDKPLVVDDGARTVTASYSKNQELRERHAVNSDRHLHALHHHNTGDSNRILLVTVQNPTYPITTDLMHGVFHTYGNVEKVVIFVKPVGLQCLVQFATLEEAITAKHALNGLSVFPDCCGLVIHFSNLPQELIVKENGLRTKDYTNLSLPPPPNDSAVNSGNDMLTPAPIYGYAAPVAAVSSASMLASGHQPHHHHLHAPLMHHQGMLHHPHHAMPHHIPHHNHHGHHHGHPHIHPAMLVQQPPPIVSGVGREVASPVLLVCNLRESVTCDHLFNLFSCYGNVVRVKKLAAKSDHALVQFSNQLAAQSALVHLRGFTLLSRSLEISYSKHAYIAVRPANGVGIAAPTTPTKPTKPTSPTAQTTEPTGVADTDAVDVSALSVSSEDHLLMKEFGHSVNRFTGKYANGTKHIYSPTKIIHVSNLDETVTAEQLREHLSSFQGGEHCKVKLFTNTNGHTQALAEFPTVDAATTVLAQAHNASLASRRLKLAFSRKTLHN